MFTECSLNVPGSVGACAGARAFFYVRLRDTGGNDVTERTTYLAALPTLSARVVGQLDVTMASPVSDSDTRADPLAGLGFGLPWLDNY
jgi:hypothetical protein